MISVERFINDDGITVWLVLTTYVLEFVYVQTAAKLRCFLTPLAGLWGWWILKRIPGFAPNAINNKKRHLCWMRILKLLKKRMKRALVVLKHHQQMNSEKMSMKTQRPNPRRKYKLLDETHVFIWTAGTKFRSLFMQKSSHKNKLRTHVYLIKFSISCHISGFSGEKDKWQKKDFLKTPKKRRGKTNRRVRV